MNEPFDLHLKFVCFKKKKKKKKKPRSRGIDVRNHGGCVAKPSHHGKRKERVSCGPPVAFSLLVHVTATKYHT